MSSLSPPVPLHFLVPGFSKCGTTTLCDLLAEHPQLFMPTGDKKEPRFFDKPDFDEQWSHYIEYFTKAQPGALLGEGSQSYSGVCFGEASRRRLLKLYPHIKLIFIARDPIDRMESSYREFHHSGTRYAESAPFPLKKALERFPQIIEDARFFTRISNYRDHMPANQILVIFLEDLKSNPQEELARCFTFLGIDSKIQIPRPDRHLNTGNHKLYDTKQLRDMRSYVLNPETSVSLGKLDLDIQDQLLEPLGLRRRFAKGPLEWDQHSRDRVVEALRDEIPVFLKTFGKPPDFWPRFSQIVETGKSDESRNQ